MNLKGTWVNQNGSELRIEAIEPDGFHGTFVSAKGRAAQGVTYPVSGLSNGELLSFTVNFKTSNENLHSIVSFSGRIKKDEPNRMHAMWILMREFEDIERIKRTDIWNTFMINQDVFELKST